MLAISSISSNDKKLFYAPAVSMASGAKICVFARFEYNFESADLFAAALANIAVFHEWDSAKVSMMATSNAMGLPLIHGINVALSGRFPSVHIRPAGSLAAGVLARRIDL